MAAIGICWAGYLRNQNRNMENIQKHPLDEHKVYVFVADTMIVLPPHVDYALPRRDKLP